MELIRSSIRKSAGSAAQINKAEEPSGLLGWFRVMRGISDQEMRVRFEQLILCL
jgi:hypothetical protein